MVKLYTIHCLQGSPLSTWFEPRSEKEILDTYYEQYLDFRDQEYDTLKRSEFTRELFEDMWECKLEEVTHETSIN